jgi:hypothetical protein
MREGHVDRGRHWCDVAGSLRQEVATLYGCQETRGEL